MATTAEKPKKGSAEKSSSKQFKITQIRSLIACTKSQRATMEALGLRGRHKFVHVSDNPANRGQIMKVQHLVTVEVL